MKKGQFERYIKIRGAGEHNLKDLDVDIPKDRLVVLTGLSGSGKSSLAFDTIYAEGQRRYMESLSSYARQFLGQMEKPRVESIEGLSPAISIDQKSTNRNPRSTVGTVTEIYDYLRLLYARVGTPHCPRCGKKVEKQTADQMVDKIMELPEKAKIQVLSPVVRGKKGQHEKVFESAKKSGFVRVNVDGIVYDLDDTFTLEKNIKHDIDIVVDRLVVKEGIDKRLTDSVETALRLSDGLMEVSAVGGKPAEERTDLQELDPDITDGSKDKASKKTLVKETECSKIVLAEGEEITLKFSQSFSCADCGISIEEIEPRSFSFNNPFGACPACFGLGFKMEFDPELMIPDETLSISEGAIAAYGWLSANDTSSFSGALLKAVADEYGFSLDTPFKDYPKKIRDIILYGTGGRRVNVHYTSERGRGVYPIAYSGLMATTEQRYRETASDTMKEQYETFMRITPCTECKGQRLKQSSLAVTVADKNIYEMTQLSIDKLAEFMGEVTFTKREMEIAGLILKEIRERLKFLLDVGLDYLSLSRATGSLSGGEAQRIRLATQIGSGLTGVVYILDEPSIGLHQRDNDKLLATLEHLRDLGNSVIVVEHDEDTMRAADWIIDIGPGAGEHGGEVVAEGTAGDICKNKKSLTGAYLAGREAIPVPVIRNVPNAWLKIKGARENNLKNVNVDIPLGVLTCVTGVSGSGKSSLINEILYKTLAKKVNRVVCVPGKHDTIEGVEQVDKVIDIDQAPIGRTPRSNPATYTGVFDIIRDLFAATEDAKERGYKKGRFSFNVKGGRCEACSGDGIIKIEMHFLPDVYVPCEVCGGKRYNRETLEVKYKGKTIYDVLNMTVDEAVGFFENVPTLKRRIETIQEVGLGYVRLGQPSTELSGGEAQRMKIASELSKKSTGRTVYILDEPTTGLHFADVHRLTEILRRLTEGGNTVVVIEHNLDVIKTADHIIDMGPEGGDGGGTVIAKGSPEEIVKVKKSYTGKYLKKYLKN